MKVTLDLTDLVARGALTKAEADRLAVLGNQETGTLGVNILMGFGVIAVVLGVGIVLPNITAAAVLSAVLFFVGLGLIVNKQTQWLLFARTCLTIGSLGLMGTISFIADNNFYVGLALTLWLGASAAIATSGLLAALTILELSITLGAGTAYWHATYAAWVERPAVTIAILAAVTLGLFAVSLRVPAAYERVAVIGARTAILVINLGFLVGSVFGDPMLGWPASYFSIAWALLLIGVGLWAVTANRRWVVNAAAVFGAIHFYTQWFEYLGLNPFSVLGGGLLLIGFGFLLRWFNQRVARSPDPSAAEAA